MQVSEARLLNRISTDIYVTVQVTVVRTLLV